MSATIKAVVGEQGIAVNNGGFARPIIIPSGITQLRLGIRYWINYSAAPGGTPLLGLGMTTGTTNILGDATTDRFVGLMGRNMYWDSGNGAQDWTFYPCTKEGTTLTYGTAVGSVVSRSNGAGNTGACFCDIRLAGGLIYIRSFFPNSYYSHCPSADFYYQMPLATPVFSSFTLTAEQTVAGTTTNFWANRAVNFWWNRTEFDWNVLDLAMSAF